MNHGNYYIKGAVDFPYFEVVKFPKMYQLSGKGINLFLDVLILVAFLARNFLMAYMACYHSEESGNFLRRLQSLTNFPREGFNHP